LRRFTNSGIGFPDPSWVINALRSSLGLPLPRPSFNLPDVAPVGRLPRGGVVELSGRGSTYVVDSGFRRSVSLSAIPRRWAWRTGSNSRLAEPG